MSALEMCIFQSLSRNNIIIFVVDSDILYKLCGSANKWSKLKDLSSLVRYDSSLAAIRHVQSIIPVV